MTDDDFDIDIYGDANTEERMFKKDEEGDVKIDDNVKVEAIGNANGDDANLGGKEHRTKQSDEYVESHSQVSSQGQQQIKSTDESGHDVLTIPKKAPQQQGVKRKEGSDDRPIDPGATSAILISDLHWWNNDDDIRGWVNQAQCEDELKDITFSEHKVNGKSKGQAYVEFTSQQAATAAKRKIDTFGEGQQYIKKHSVTYSNPNVNPFRTLPKDAPMRAGKDGPNIRSTTGGYNDQNRQNNFRGRTPGYNANRGNSNTMSGGFNRNFSGPSMGSMSGGFQPSMGGFQGGAIGGQFGGFNRGGMMGSGMRGGGGMRGGRGTMGSSMMGAMPMGGMAMGNMPMAGMVGPMGMGQMGGGMPGMFQQPHRKDFSLTPLCWSPVSQFEAQPKAGAQCGGNLKVSTIPQTPSGTIIDPSRLNLASYSDFPTPQTLAFNSPSGQIASSFEFHNPRVSVLHGPSGQRHRHHKSRHCQPELALKLETDSPQGANFPGMQPHFNPAFFQQNQSGGGDWQNPHGAKRPRPE